MLKSVIFTDEGKRMYFELFVYLNVAAFCILAFICLLSLLDDEYVSSGTCPVDCTQSDCVIYVRGSGRKTEGPCLCQFVGSGVTQYSCTNFATDSTASFWQRKPFITGVLSFYIKYFLFVILPLTVLYYWWSIGAARRDAERRALYLARQSDSVDSVVESSRSRKRINDFDTVDEIMAEEYSDKETEVKPIPVPLTADEAIQEQANMLEYQRQRAEYDKLYSTSQYFFWTLFFMLWLLMMLTIFALAYDADSDGYVPTGTCPDNCVPQDCHISVFNDKFEGTCRCSVVNSVGTTTEYCDRFLSDPNASYLQRNKNMNNLVIFCEYSVIIFWLPFGVLYWMWKRANNVPHFFYYSRGEGLRNFEERTEHIKPRRNVYF